MKVWNRIREVAEVVLGAPCEGLVDLRRETDRHAGLKSDEEIEAMARKYDLLFLSHPEPKHTEFDETLLVEMLERDWEGTVRQLKGLKGW